MDHVPVLFGTLEPIPLALYFTAAIYVSLGIHTLRQRARGPTASYLVGMMFAMAWWSYSYGVEIHVTELSAKLFWVKIEYPAIVSISIFWLYFVLEYTGRSALLTLRNKILATIVPVLTVLAMWTNELHHLMYTVETRVESTGNLILLDATHGPFFWFFIVYFYLIIGGGSLLLLVHTLRSPSLYRYQIYLILLATISPWMASIIYVSGLFPIPGLDITPFGFIPTGLVMTWAIARFHLLDIVPPQQDIILQRLSDGVILLDSQRRVNYLNHAAEDILEVDADRCLGQPVEMVCKQCIPQLSTLLGKEESFAEITLSKNGPPPNHFEVRISPSYFTERDRRSGSPSHLIILHNITERKQAMAALGTRDAILQAVNFASELFLKSASWEKHIPAVLEQLGRAANTSRATIFKQHSSEDGQNTLISQRYEWAADGVEKQMQNPMTQNFPWNKNGLDRWADTLQRGTSIHGLVREFPDSEQGMFLSMGIRSMAVMPIFSEESFWGFIAFDDCIQERIWSEVELEALRTAAGLFGAALTRQKVEIRLLDRQRSQNLLQEIIRLALSKNDIREMSRVLVEHLGILIGADHCFLSLWDKRNRKAIPVAAYGVDEERYRSMETFPDEKTLTASALETGEMQIVEDWLNSTYVSARLAELFGTHSVLALPMIANEAELGAVLLGFVQPHRFTEDEIILSEQAADLVALALAKFQAVEEAHRRAEEAETLRRAGAAVSETLDLQEATTRILEQLAFVIPHDSASVQLLRDGELEIIGGEGWDNISQIIGVRFHIPGDNPNSVVIETRKPFLVNDTYATFPDFRNIPHASHIRSWLGVPLIVRGQVIGLLAIDSREINHFDPDNIDLVTAFAGQVAVAIENARLFDETQQLATTDGMTGLYNFRHFLELAHLEFERAVRYKRHLSLLLFDIDHFKDVNDKYGHPAGDQVLVALANLCRDKLREIDPLGRYGGEEFVALILEADATTAFNVAERLRREVEKLTIPASKGDLHITVSIGVAEYNEDTPNLEALIARADQAMYVAKHKGRNRVCVGK